MFLNVFMSVRSFWWIQLCMNLFQHLSLNNLFHLVHGEVHTEAKPVPPNVTKNTKLQGVQHSPEVAFRNTDFCVPENLIFPTLHDNI